MSAMDKTQPNIPLDIYGRQIRIGDWISYPVRHSSHVWFEHSKVESIEVTPPRYGTTPRVSIVGVKAGGKKVQIMRVDRVVLAPEGWTPPT